MHKGGGTYKETFMLFYYIFRYWNEQGDVKHVTCRTVLGQTLFFTADDGQHGEELWRSDGTTSGTILFKDIDPVSSSLPSDLTVVRDHLYFCASNGVNGSEPWVSDGSNEGTFMLRDIFPFSSGSNAFGFTDLDGQVLFITKLPGFNRGVWKTDGSTTGTVPVWDVMYPGPDSVNPPRLVAWRGRVFFPANGLVGMGSNGTYPYGYELWASDGTATGTTLVRDINPGGNDSNCYAGLVALDDTLILSANDGVHGQELWRSDGTASRTVLLKDIFIGATDSYPASLTCVGDHVFFVATDAEHGRELWRSDGTSSGTHMVREIFPGASYEHAPVFLAVMDNILFFAADDSEHGQELWRSDGTEAGTWMIKDICPGPGPANLTAPGSGKGIVAIMGHHLYFCAQDGTGIYEIWRTDGTAAGTRPVVDGLTGQSIPTPTEMAALGGRLFFSGGFADGGQKMGRELFVLEPDSQTGDNAADAGWVLYP